MRRGFNEPRTYYFFVMRRLIADPARRAGAVRFRRAIRWQEIDYARDIAAARERVGAGVPSDARERACTDAVPEAHAELRECVGSRRRPGSGGSSAEYAQAIRLDHARQRRRARPGSQRDLLPCQALRGRRRGRLAAVVKVPRMGPQRTNADTSFSWEARILASLPAAGITAAPGCSARVAAAGDALPVHGRGCRADIPDPAHPSAGRAADCTRSSTSCAQWTRAA